MLHVEATGLPTHAAALPVARGTEGHISGLVCSLRLQLNTRTCN